MSGRPVTRHPRPQGSAVRVLRPNVLPQEDRSIELVVQPNVPAFRGLALAITIYGVTKGYDPDLAPDVYFSLQKILALAAIGNYTPTSTAPEWFWHIYNGLRPRSIPRNGGMINLKFSPKGLDWDKSETYVSNVHAGKPDPTVSLAGFCKLNVTHGFPADWESVLNQFFGFIAQDFPRVPYSSKYDSHGASAFAWRTFNSTDINDLFGSRWGTNNLEVPITSWMGYCGFSLGGLESGAPRLPLYFVSSQGGVIQHLGARLHQGRNGFSPKHKKTNVRLKFFDVNAAMLESLYSLTRIANKAVNAGLPPADYPSLPDKVNTMYSGEYLTGMLYILQGFFDQFSFVWGGAADQIHAIRSGTAGTNPLSFTTAGLPAFIVEALRSSMPVYNGDADYFIIPVPASHREQSAGWDALASLLGWTGPGAPGPVVEPAACDMMNQVFQGSLPPGVTDGVFTMFTSPNSYPSMSTILNLTNQMNQQWLGWVKLAAISSPPHDSTMSIMGYTTVLTLPGTSKRTVEYLSRVWAFLFSGEQKKCASQRKAWSEYLAGRLKCVEPATGLEYEPSSLDTTTAVRKAVINFWDFSHSFVFDSQLLLPFVYNSPDLAIDTVKIIYGSHSLGDATIGDNPYAPGVVVGVDNFVNNPTNGVESEYNAIIDKRIALGAGGAVSDVFGGTKLARVLDKLANAIPGVRRINNNPAVVSGAKIAGDAWKAGRAARKTAKNAGGGRAAQKTAARTARRRAAGERAMDMVIRN